MASVGARRLKAQALPQLRCEKCRERKIKCDKLDPCTNCKSAGLICVAVRRQRLPRGRHTTTPHSSSPDSIQASSSQHDHVLKPSDSSSKVTTVETHTNTSTNGSPSAVNAAPTPGRYWTNFIGEDHGLRSVVESAVGAGDEHLARQPLPLSTTIPERGIRVFGFSSSTDSSLASVSVPGAVALQQSDRDARQLLSIYLDQVDPVIKILHRPSLERSMKLGQQYLKYPPDHVAVIALFSAVCYSAACTLTEKRCQEIFGCSKSALVASWRVKCETTIERTDLLSTQDITVLQAFVLYLVGRRTEDRSKAVWTLVAVAVRIAKGLHLNLTPAARHKQQETFFEEQLRKRLWLTICLLDIQASMGQASEPLISHEEILLSLPAPRHINDADFGPHTTEPVPNEEGITDTTFALVTYHLQLRGRHFSFTARERNSVENPNQQAILESPVEKSRLQQHAKEFEEAALQLLHFCDPESSSHAWRTWHGTQCLVAGARLAAARSIHGAPPPSQTGHASTEILRLAMHVLEKANLMHSDWRGAAIRWYVAIPLPVLAVAIAECFACSDAALVRRAWPLVEAAYRYHRAGNAWYSSRDLLAPLAALMQRTREKLAPILQGAQGEAERETTTGGIRAGQRPINAFNDVGSQNRDESTGDQARTPSNWAFAATPASSVTQLAVSPSAGGLVSSGDSQMVGDDVVNTESFPTDWSDDSWQAWEQFMSSVSLEDFTWLGMYNDSSL